MAIIGNLKINMKNDKNIDWKTIAKNIDWTKSPLFNRYDPVPVFDEEELEKARIEEEKSIEARDKVQEKLLVASVVGILVTLLMLLKTFGII